MTKNLLLATLGTSPAVITEAVDLLREEGVAISGVYLFVTRDRDVQDSFMLLAEHLPQHDGIVWIHPIEVGVYYDIDSTDAAVEFLALASQQLKTLRDAGYRVYVSIAGGRKAMAALLALAVQFYGAERLFHIWVPPEGLTDSNVLWELMEYAPFGLEIRWGQWGHGEPGVRAQPPCD